MGNENFTYDVVEISLTFVQHLLWGTIVRNAFGIWRRTEPLMIHPLGVCL